MKLVNRVTVSVFVSVFGGGCVQEAPPTVDYFRAHREERVAQLRRCINDAARSKSDPACVNAREAERVDSVGTLRDLPPVGLAPVPPTSRDEERPRGHQD